MHFCVRDDDTSAFTRPEDLEGIYGGGSHCGPVSLAVVPFHRAGTSKGVPERLRGRWSVHPLHENGPLVDYLRAGVAAGRFEIMLHGYYHDEPERAFEFVDGRNLVERVSDGRKYLQDLLETRIRMFVAPRNALGKTGLRALASEGLHLAGVTGVRAGWPLLSSRTWSLWRQLRRWRANGGVGVPWVLDVRTHREVKGIPVTPAARFDLNQTIFEQAATVDGVFCLATHYWEVQAQSRHAGMPGVREQLQYFFDRARSDPRVTWRSVGDVVSDDALTI
jgi:predicted deacetylase